MLITQRLRFLELGQENSELYSRSLAYKREK